MSDTIPEDEPIHAIGLVCRRTGLKPDLVRAWERRYGVVEPSRSAGDHRLYTEADIARLSLLARATREGHTIGRIAELSNAQLRDLIAATEKAVAGRIGQPGKLVEECLERCLGAVADLASDRLLGEFERASLDLGRQAFVEEILEPLMRRIGERWERGDLRPAHEHLATAAVRTFLSRLPVVHRPEPGAPVIVVATPAGQLHEIGALLAAATAAAEGWVTAYLGPDLPWEDIGVAARKVEARAVALSVTYPPPSGSVRDELVHLATHLGDVPLFVGGRASGDIAELLAERGIHHVRSLADLRTRLESLG